MKSLPTKQKQAQMDLDKLIPLPKKELDKNRKDKITSSKNNKIHKSEEIVVDEDDNESVDPPSDTEVILHASSATLRGSSKPKWFSQQLKAIPQEVKIIPSLDRSKPKEPTNEFSTPEADSQHEYDNPSTMTHLSDTKRRVSDCPTSSSQLPYSSPVVDKYGRSGNIGIINPIPVRDKSSQIAHLQKMAHLGKLPSASVWSS